MQTFLPYGSDFEMTAFCLDMQRLGKQRVETFQILKALTVGGGWVHHPATKMWRGYEEALAFYGATMCREWIGRGYQDTLLSRFEGMTGGPVDYKDYPHWIDNQALVISHRSNLIRKKPDYYSTMWPGIPDNLPYVWPSDFEREIETYPMDV